MTREEAEKKCCLWGVNDPETMDNTDPDEAIVEWLSSIPRYEVHDTFELVGYKRMPVSYHHQRIVDVMLEQLDDEYGGPDGDYTKPTAAMLEAGRVFVSAVLAEYKTWACEEVYREVVNVEEWVRAHPDLVDDEE